MPFENVAEEIVYFVDRYVDTFACWDILEYFHENPGVSLDLGGVAVEIGRKASSLDESVNRLVELGLLDIEEGKAGTEPTFEYTAPIEFRLRMDRFLDATRDRTNRLAIVSLVLKKEARRI